MLRLVLPSGAAEREELCDGGVGPEQQELISAARRETKLRTGPQTHPGPAGGPERYTGVGSSEAGFYVNITALMSLSFGPSVKSEGQAEELKRLQSKLEQQTQVSAQEQQNFKKTLCDAEARNNK